MDATTAYYLVSIMTLVDGSSVMAETKNTKFPTEVECMKAAIQAQPFLDMGQLIRCDPGGPDTPTMMELAGGE